MTTVQTIDLLEWAAGLLEEHDHEVGPKDEIYVFLIEPSISGGLHALRILHHLPILNCRLLGRKEATAGWMCLVVWGGLYELEILRRGGADPDLPTPDCLGIFSTNIGVHGGAL